MIKTTRQTAAALLFAPVVGLGTPSAHAVELWGVQRDTGNIVRVDPATGGILDSFAAPDALSATDVLIGLSGAEDGQTLLYRNDTPDVDFVLYRLDPQTGVIKSTESVDDSGGFFVATGLSYQSDGVNDYIFSNDIATNDIHRQTNFSGTFQAQWSGGEATAIGGDGFGREFGYFLDGKIHEYDPFVDDYNGDPLGATDADYLNTLPNPSAGDLTGLAFDGIYLYAADAAGNLFTLDAETGIVLNTVTVAGGELHGLGIVPEPATGLLLLLGTTCLAQRKRGQRRSGAPA